jgi:PD-(D/E)XK endonuclease
MRVLGYGERSKSAGAIRIVRRRASELDLDTSHFRGKRRWTDPQLRQAVSEARSWEEVLTALGLSTRGGSMQPHVKAHTIRLGLDTSHLSSISHRGPGPSQSPAEMSELQADHRFLRVAGPAVAASWFALRGCPVSFPIEPTVYDLLVDGPTGTSRVQVKTTTTSTKDGWMATVGHHPDTHARKGLGHRLVAYDPEFIDLFFVIDGDLAMYLIPSRAVASRLRILLRTYKKYIVGNAAGLLGASSDAARGAAVVSQSA